MLEVIFIPAGGEAFVLDTDLVRGLVFQHRQCGATKDAEVGVGVSFSDAALVLLKGDVELPVQTVFDTPVAAYGLGKEGPSCARLKRFFAVVERNPRLVLALRMNAPDAVNFRRLWIEIVTLAARFAPDLCGWDMGYPEDLPDLARLRRSPVTP